MGKRDRSQLAERPRRCGGISCRGVPPRKFGRTGWGWPKLVLTVVLGWFTLASIGCSHIQVDGIPLNEWVKRTSFQTLASRQSEGASAEFDDLDQDGRDEVIWIINTRDTTGLSMASVAELDAVSSVWGGYNEYGLIGYAGKIDYDQNGRPEAALVIDRFNGEMIFLLHPFVAGDTARAWLIARQDTIFPRHVERVGFRNVRVLPEEVLGFPAVLGGIITTFFAVPRQIFLLDLKADSFAFNFALGPLPTGFCIADFDRDGTKEILVGTWAPGNGAKANGFSDSEAWLILLDTHGNVKYAKRLGQYQAFVHVCPNPFYLGDAPATFVIRTHHGAKQQLPDFVGLWTWSKREDFPKVNFEDGLLGSCTPVFAHDPRTGAHLAYVIRASGELVVLNQDLQLVHTRRLDFTHSPSSLNTVFADNLLGDESPEIVLHDRKRAYVLDSNMRVLWHASAREVRGPVRLGGAHKGFWYLGEDGHWHVGMLRPHWSGLAVLYGGPALAILLLIGTAIGVSNYRKRTRQWQSWQGSALRAWVLESSDVGLILFDAAGKLQSINRRARELLRLPDEVPGTINGFRRELASSPFARAFDLLWRLDASDRLEAREELSVPWADGIRRFELVVSKVEADPGRRVGSAVVIRDVTALVQSRDLTAWTNVARRLAHEIKNPLATMLLAAERLSATLGQLPDEAGKGAQRYLSHILREMDRLRRMATLIMQLTDLEPAACERVDVNQSVREALEQLGGEIPENVRLEVRLAEKLPAVRARRRSLVLALTNVIRNAVQAVGEEGKVEIVTDVAQWLHIAEKGLRGNFVSISVSDTGGGIPEEARGRIFEPYFSLRKDGTGLGLAIVRKVVEDIGGHIEFQSEEGVGTTFWLYLPVEEASAQEKKDGGEGENSAG